MCYKNKARKVDRKIKACSINICGFSERSQFTLNHFIDEEEIDLLAVQETLSDDLDKLTLLNMTSICDTNKAKNKGAALFINNKHSLTKIEDISKVSRQLDSCWGLAVMYNKRIIIGSIYVKLNYKPAIEEVVKMLKAAQQKQHELKASGIILTGDFNARHQSWGDSINGFYGKRLTELLDYTEFSICTPDSPTFLGANNANSYIDLFIVSTNLVESVNSCKTDNEVELYSGAPKRGHVPVIMEMSVSTSPSKIEIKKTLDVNNLNWEEWASSIEDGIEEIKDYLNSLDNPYTLWNRLNYIITKATDLHGKFKKSCHHSKPYWTELLTVLSNKLKVARKNYVMRNTDNNLKSLTDAKEAFENERKTVCQEFLINTTKQLNSAQSRQFWKDFNKIFKKKSLQKIDPLLTEKKELLTENNQIEECLFSVFFEAKHLVNGNFDDAFYEEINNIYDKIINENIQPPPNTYKKCNLYDEIKIEEIRKAMKSKGKSVDNYGFHPKMMKHLGDQAIVILQKLFNLCLSTGQWVWDGAEVIFLRKEGKDSYSKPGSYRPICITAYLGKLFEGIITTRIELYLLINNLVDPDQEGFSARKNTIRYLNRLHLGIEADKENCQTILCLFVDFEKAFDSVWKKGLIYKLHQIGIKGSILKLLNHFLFSRKVTLNINGERGETRQSADYGLPQGSVLSPLLFKIFVTDFLAELNQEPNISVYKFADDGTVKITADNSQLCIEKLSYVLKCLRSWTQKWHMKVNCDRNKTEIICFNTAEKNKSIIPETFQFGEEVIHKVKETTVLGLKIDEDLTYIPHSHSVLNSLHHRWVTLCKYSNRNWGFNQKVMLYLVITLFLSKLSYASHIWMSKDNMKEINQLWYHIIKSITGAVFNIKQCVAEIILGTPPIMVQTKMNSIKHFLKIVNQPINEDRYKEFLMSVYSNQSKSPLTLHNTYKEVFRFLEWKEKLYPSHFNENDKIILHNKDYCSFPLLSEKSCSYTKNIAKKYVDKVLWKAEIHSQFQMDGHMTSPNPLSEMLPIPQGTSRNVEVLVMSLLYKNNLLNQNLWNLSQVPSPLCSACSLQEETADHILFECSAVDLNLRTLSKQHYNRINNISDDYNLETYIGLLNARSDPDFILVCINIVKSLRLRETIVL